MSVPEEMNMNECLLAALTMKTNCSTQNSFAMKHCVATAYCVHTMICLDVSFSHRNEYHDLFVSALLSERKSLWNPGFFFVL